MAKYVEEQRLLKENELLTKGFHELCKEYSSVWPELDAEKHQVIIEEYKKRLSKNKPEVPAEVKCTDDTFVVIDKKDADKPKTWFNLMQGDRYQVLDHIGRLTNRFRDIDPDLTYWLMDRIGRRPHTTFGYMQAPFNRNIIDVDMIKQIIGKDGYYFKLTTTNTGVDFIWHDRVENHFLFWGEKKCVVQAMKIIQSRIKLVETRTTTNNLSEKGLTKI